MLGYSLMVMYIVCVWELIMKGSGLECEKAFWWGIGCKNFAFVRGNIN